MRDPLLQQLWNQFINDDKYRDYFSSNETNWKIRF